MPGKVYPRRACRAGLTPMKKLALTLVAGVVLACTGSSETQRRDPAAATAASLAGTWSFALEASDVAAAMRARCASEGRGDQVRADACFEEVRKESSLEKVRWATSLDGVTTWTSFVAEPGGEEVLLVVPVEFVASGSGEAAMRATGAADGKQAPAFDALRFGALRIVRVDDRRISMHDPDKGRLVFTRD